MYVSFIIPTRNQSGFIKKCIDSCLAQELPEAETIVVDGASTDGTPQVLASYGSRVRWVSEPDDGHADAVNKGVAMARGDLIAWINSDDFYPHSRVLPRVVSLAEAERLDVVYGDGLMVDSRGGPLRVHRGRDIPRMKDMLLATPSGFVMQPAVFFRKSLFEAAGALSKEWHWCLDLELWLRMFPLAKRIRYVPEQWACATYHADAKSIKGMLPHIHETRVLKKRYSRQFGLTTMDRVRMGLGICRLYGYWVAVQLGLKRAA